MTFVDHLGSFRIMAVFGGIIVLVELLRLLSAFGCKALSTRKAQRYRVVNGYRDYILEAPMLRQSRAQAYESKSRFHSCNC